MSYAEMSTKVPWSLVKSGFKKTPHFESLTQKPAGGRGRTSIALQPFASWDFEVDLNYVQGGETVQGSVLQSFLGCYLRTCGGGAFFLFTDPNDNTVSPTESRLLNVTPGAAAPMGATGDGVSQQFQFARAIDCGLDVLQNVLAPTVYINDQVAAGEASAAGVFTFAAPPASGAKLTWDGRFRYLCQFKDDSLTDLARLSKNASGWLWSCASIGFEGVLV